MGEGLSRSQSCSLRSVYSVQGCVYYRLQAEKHIDKGSNRVSSLLTSSIRRPLKASSISLQSQHGLLIASSTFFYQGLYCEDEIPFGNETYPDDDGWKEDDESKDETRKAIRRRALLDIDMYSLADKYDIAGLSALAKQSYFEHLMSVIEITEEGNESKNELLSMTQVLLRTISRLYESTPESNRGLRDIAVEYAVRCRRELTMDESHRKYVKELIARQRQFAWDLLVKMCETL